MLTTADRRRLLNPRAGAWVRVWLAPMGREVIGQVAREGGEVVVRVAAPDREGASTSVRLMLPHDAWAPLQ